VADRWDRAPTGKAADPRELTPETYLELAPRVAPAVWLAFLASVVVGVGWDWLVERAVNRPPRSPGARR
jgi:hypothetical protein